MKAFIDEHREAYGGEPICKVLPIAPSTYYLHAARRLDSEKRSARARRDEVLSQSIQKIWDENFQAYGARKVWLQLQREGERVARCTVERLMRLRGLRGVVRGKTVKTTVSNPAVSCPLDRVNRQFPADRPNALWVADFTFVSTVNAFILRGAKPVFIDVRMDTFNLDESQLEAKITSKTKAVVPVHYAGIRLFSSP